MKDSKVTCHAFSVGSTLLDDEYKIFPVSNGSECNLPISRFADDRSSVQPILGT